MTQPGKTDLLKWLVTLVLAAIVSYFTAVSAMRESIAEVREREDNHFAEVLRRLELLQYDVRELRSR